MPQVALPFPSVSVYSFGSPADTGAFSSPPSSWIWAPGELPNWCHVDEAVGTAAAQMTIALGSSDKIVGLGLHVGPLNCRGNVFSLFASDNSVHTPAVRSMYGAHSFHVVLRDRPVGIFIDSPGEVTVDAGCSRRDTLAIKVAEPGWRLVVLEGTCPAEIIGRYLSLTGTPYIPPRWAFGFHQSRWSYKNEAEVREVAKKVRSSDIPCDVIHLDIHYMDAYKVFTVDEDRFPSMENLAAGLREEGIRLVSILDPGVKAEKGFPVFDEGVERGFFCTKRDGEDPFLGAVWPGLAAFPDFFRADVRRWWGEHYLRLKAKGIAGFWNDMNEPAIFYTPSAVRKFASDAASHAESGEFPEELANLIFSPALGNRRSYFEEFFHSVDGARVPNRAVHNLYGTRMTQATADALAEAEPGKRQFVLSRSSYPGMHRYAAVWTGDNHSWWEHLSLNIQQLISLNMSGFLFCGADTGGFGGDCSPDMLVRWTQLSAFSPFCRNHAAMWSPAQEPWAFDEETLALCRSSIKLRYALMPYLYGEFVRAALSHQPFIRGLFLDSTEGWERLSADQFLCGHSLLVAPVVEPGATQRQIWLPAGSWLQADASPSGLAGRAVLAGGDIRLGVNLSSIPVFIKNGSLVPMSGDEPSKPGALSRIPSRYRLLGFADTKASCWLLLDDGEASYGSWEEWPKCLCTAELKAGTWDVSLDFGRFPPQPLELECELWDGSGRKTRLDMWCP